MNKRIILGFIFLVLGIGIVNAQTLITGKIYDSANVEVGEASIQVICNDNPLDTITSKDDGTYAVRYELTNCNEGDSVKVTATKGNYKGESTNIITACENPESCEGTEYVSVLNVIIKQLTVPPAPSDTNNNGGGGSAHFYRCGNNRCDSGETIVTCPRDCIGVVEPSTEQLSDEGAEELASDETINLTDNVDGNSNPIKLTLENIGTVRIVSILLIFLILVIGAWAVRRKRKSSPYYS